MPEHGKYSTYNNHDCRCAPCTAAATDYMRKYRQSEKGRLATRRSNKITERTTRLAAQWVRENQPEIWQQMNDKAKSEVVQQMP